MARASHTPITFFMGMTLRELYRWIETVNEVEEEDEERRKET